MDFGIARAVADTSATMTQTQAVIGTAQYLSPEQAQGLPVDARSDLYSTGCLLFELLTGRPPFVGESPVSVAYQHVGEKPQPPSSFNHDVPTAYDNITLHALEKPARRRYQSATEFRNDLDRRRGAEARRPLSAAAAGRLGGGAAAAWVPAPGRRCVARPGASCPSRTCQTSMTSRRASDRGGSKTRSSRCRRSRAGPGRMDRHRVVHPADAGRTQVPVPDARRA